MTTPVDTAAAGPVEGGQSLGSRALLVISGALLLLVLVALGVGMMRIAGRDPKAPVPSKFAVAPDFTLPSFSGELLTLSSYDDRPVLLFFWASWCVPCQQEAPYIQRAWLEYQRRGFTFIGVNVYDAESDARDYISRYGFTFPVVRGEQGRVYLDYGLDAVSEAFFLRPGRQVHSRFINGLTEQSLAENLQALANTNAEAAASAGAR